MNLLSYILWNPDLEAFSLGPITLRWYGLMWMIGLALAFFVVQRLYKEQKIKDELFDPLFFYCFIGILLGARLGHCIFYQPDYFLTSWKGFIEMWLPIHFMPDGDWKVIGYAGLASHGGTDCPLALCKADQTEPLDSPRQHCHRHWYNGLFHPLGKPHEF